MSEDGARSFRDIRWLHLWFAFSALALLVVSIWAVVADGRRPWKAYQRTCREIMGTTASGRPTVEQISLPELTLDFHFRPVARLDRCPTCHYRIDKPSGGARMSRSESDLPPIVSTDATLDGERYSHPYRSHPRPELYLAADSPHPLAEFGCTICHEGQGGATDFCWAAHAPNDSRQRASWRQRHGWFRDPHWELPMLPRRFVESRCLKCHHAVTDLEPTRRFPDPPAAKLLAGYHLVRQYGCFGCHEIKGETATGVVSRVVGPDMRLEPHGAFRKVGPDLRDVAERLDRAALADRISEPAHFFPGSRMPKIWGLHEHLEGQALADARRFEAVELHAVVEYLLGAGQRAEPPPDPPLESAENGAPPSVPHGRELFSLGGCLACHRHADFPDGRATVGPDLSRLGAKYRAAGAREWLLGWLHDPSRHRPKTLMPNPLLEPAAAADIAAYLLSSREGASGWRPRPIPPLNTADLQELLRLGGRLPETHRRQMLPASNAAAEAATSTTSARYLPQEQTLPLQQGTSQHPQSPLGEVLAADEQKALRALGRWTLARRGCTGCHDIPGLEDTPSIGPALSDWGRKHQSLLAFERVGEYLRAQPPTEEEADFYRQAVLEKRREGFAWQKLAAPRSFDYRVAATKPYDQWLLMGRFPFTPTEREAVVTFLLALVGSSPAPAYLPQPDRQRLAILQGRVILAKYGCAQCHVLKMEQWRFRPNGKVAKAVGGAAATAETKDGEGAEKYLARDGAVAEIVGMPRLDAAGKPLEDEDDEGRTVYYFTLWEPAIIAGRHWPVGGADVIVSQDQLLRQYPAWGGEFSRALYPLALTAARRRGAVAVEQEVWGWGPPPLVGQGAKVEPAWLYNYLLHPQPIRPASLLRMPQFNLSPSEAQQLTACLVALSGMRLTPSSGPVLPPPDTAKTMRRLDGAWRILTDRATFCAKCHLLGEQRLPEESRAIRAPDLTRVAGRLRPDYLRRWLAEPKAILPYTAMPSLFPREGPPLGQDLFPVPSREQLDAVVTLLLNYDWYQRNRQPTPARRE